MPPKQPIHRIEDLETFYMTMSNQITRLSLDIAVLRDSVDKLSARLDAVPDVQRLKNDIASMQVQINTLLKVD